MLFTLRGSPSTQHLEAEALEEGVQLRLRRARHKGGGANARTVQMQDRQHRTISGRIDELRRMPRGRHWTCLSLAVADDTSDDEILVVEYCTVGVEERIPQLAALVEGARAIRGDMGGNAARPGELLEKQTHAVERKIHLRINLRICPLEVGAGNDPGAAVARPGHVAH